MADQPILPDHEEREERKQNRKIDLSLSLAIGALLITALQFIVSTPFFQDYYYQATFAIQENEPTLSGKSYTTNYVVTNTSNNTASNIDIGVLVLKGDKVQIMPAQNLEVAYKDNGPVFKECYFSVSKLVPKENMVIMVHSNVDSLRYYNTDFLKQTVHVKNEYDKQEEGKKNSYLMFPNVLYAKFDKGFGQITRQPAEKIFNIIGTNTSDSVKTQKL